MRGRNVGEKYSFVIESFNSKRTFNGSLKFFFLILSSSLLSLLFLLLSSLSLLLFLLLLLLYKEETCHNTCLTF